MLRLRSTRRTGRVRRLAFALHGIRDLPLHVFHNKGAGFRAGVYKFKSGSQPFFHPNDRSLHACFWIVGIDSDEERNVRTVRLEHCSPQDTPAGCEFDDPSFGSPLASLRVFHGDTRSDAWARSSARLRAHKSRPFAPGFGIMPLEPVVMPMRARLVTPPQCASRSAPRRRGAE